MSQSCAESYSQFRPKICQWGGGAHVNPMRDREEGEGRF